jgi:hypothetical protein
MSDLERILKLAGQSVGNFAQSPAMERQMKPTGDAPVEESRMSDMMIAAAEMSREEFAKEYPGFADEYDELRKRQMDEADIDENAFNQAAAAAARAGESEFEFGGKKYKTKMDKETAHKLDDDVQFEAEEAFEETLEETPTMDTTQLIIMLRNAGLSEAAIQRKINEWANSAPGAAEQQQTSHGEPYENFAQSVNLSLKRYLDAENMKVNVSEHTVENMKALYESKKSKSK